MFTLHWRRSPGDLGAFPGTTRCRPRQASATERIGHFLVGMVEPSLDMQVAERNQASTGVTVVTLVFP